MAFMTHDQLKAMGFAKLGENLQVSDKSQFYGTERIEIGDFTRIDDFCILSAGEGGISIGRYVHVACYVSLIGAGRIRLDDFSGLSMRTAVLSSSDDFSGEYLTNPTVPSKYTNVKSADVTIGRHVVVGVGCVILPGVEIAEGSAVGALTLVTNNLDPFGIYVGIPAKRFKDRSKRLLDMEKELLSPASEPT